MRGLRHRRYEGLRRTVAFLLSASLLLDLILPYAQVYASSMASESSLQSAEVSVVDETSPSDEPALEVTPEATNEDSPDAILVMGEPVTLSYDDAKVSAKATLSSDAEFSDDNGTISGEEVTLRVDECDAQAFSEVTDDANAKIRAVDVKLCDNDGAEVEQTDGSMDLSLTMTLPTKGEGATIAEVEVYRLAESPNDTNQYVEQIPSDHVTLNNGTVTIQEEQAGTYAVSYTVDYYYDGAEYHMPGGARMLLSELFELLKIQHDATDVVEAQFSDPSLLTLERYEDGSDWVIQSTGAFNTQETLTLTFTNGYRLLIDVMDAVTTSYSTDLNDFLTGWKLNMGDVVYDSNAMDDTTEIEYKPGVQYTLELNFAETPELGFDTPETNPSPMRFQLPDAFVVNNDLSMPLNVSLGRKGVFADNMITVTDGGDGHKYLELRWNWENDPTHWKVFRDSAQAKLKIAVNGIFEDVSPNVLSINGKDIAVRRQDLHNAMVSKDGLYDPMNNVINYTVTVSSQGTCTDITLTDTPGSALVYQGDIAFDSATSTNTAGTVPQITARTGNTFSVEIPALNNADCLVFTYSARVDYDAIAVSGNPSFEETGNTAQIFGDSYTLDNTAIHQEANIEFSDMEKNVVSKRGEYISGNFCYVLSWEIETNKRAQFPLADTEIKDTIAPGIQSISKYYGDNLTVKCYAQDGSLQDTRIISWEDLGVDLDNDTTWTYHIPDTDPNYRYVLTYDTIVYMGGKTETVVAENTVEGKGGIDSDRAVLPPPGPGGISVSKKAIDIGSDHVTWEIQLTLKGNAFNYERMVLTEHSGNKNDSNGMPTWQYDYLPYRWITLPGNTSGTLFKETLNKVEVLGLEGDETFSVRYGKNNATYDAPAGSSVLETDFVSNDKWNYDACAIEFYKDASRSQGNLNAPADPDESRTIVVRLTTSFPENWAIAARDYMLANNDANAASYSTHINWISVDTPDNNGALQIRAKDTDKFMNLPPRIYKTVIANKEVYPGSKNMNEKTFILNYPDAYIRNWNTTDTGALYPDAVAFPVFHYYVVLGGLKYDEPLVFEETFDTSLLELIANDPVKFPGGKIVLTKNSTGWTHNYFCSVFGMQEFLNWPPNINQANYDGTAPDIRYCFGHENVRYAHKAEDFGCALEKTDTGFRVTINELFKRSDGSLYPFYGIDYYLVPKNLECLKRIEEMARANEMAGKSPYVTLNNTVSARGSSASAAVKVGVMNDFMPIDKTSTAYVDVNNTLTAMDKDDNGKYAVPEGISKDDIQRYVMKYHVVLNKGGERLNDGNEMTAEDEYSSNLSVNFPSLRISTIPAENASKVSYDFSGNIGYFTIPDETQVTIDYEAAVLTTALGNINTSNEVRLLRYKKATSDTVDYSGASGSSAYNPSILIKKYGTGHMEKGLNGAVFQLYTYKHPAWDKSKNTAADWTPVTLGEDRHPKYYTTQNLTVGDTHYGDGYAEIELNQTEDGTNLETNKIYGLREITTPVGTATNGDPIPYQSPHNDDFYCYVFSICDADQTADYSNYVFLNGDTMTIRNTPESISLHLSKKLSGNCELSADEKNSLTYQVFRKSVPSDEEQAVYMPIMTTTTDPETGTSSDIIDPAFTNITYSQLASNGMELTGLVVQSGTTVGEYLLVEYGNEAILANHPDWSWRGNYEWTDGSAGNFTNTTYTVYDKDGANPETVKGVAFTVTSQEIRDGENKEVTLTNTYSRDTVTLTATKKWTSPSGSAIAWPSGQSVRFQLGTLNELGNFTAVDGKGITLNNVKDSEGEDTAGTATFKDLPKYEVVNGVRKDIKYAVQEVGDVSGYDKVYPTLGITHAAYGTATSVTIKNQAKSTTARATKVWANGTPSGATATFRLYSYTGDDPSAATWVSNVNDIVLDGVADEGEGTFGERALWQASFTGLPQFDSNNQELHYLVKEIVCTPSNYEATVEFVANGGTITNAIATTTYTVRKEWRGTANNAWPGSETIRLTLRREDDASFLRTYTLSQNGINQASVANNVTWNNSQLTVTGLEKYKSDGTAWRYYVTEDDMSAAGYATTYHDKNGYPVSAGKAYSGGSVRNTLSSKSIAISKSVAGNMGDKNKEFSFTILLKKADGSSYTGSVAFEKTSAETTTSGNLVFTSEGATTLLGHGERIVLNNLPGGLTYTITENPEDYIASWQLDGGTSTQSAVATGTLTIDQTIAFTNIKNVAVPSGVHTSRLALALIPVFAGCIWLLWRMRKAKDDLLAR